MSARLKLLLGVLGGLAAAAILLVLIFDWNWLKRPIEALVEDQLGREVEIAGDLEAGFSLTPSIVAHDVRLANAEWGSEPDMLQVDRLAFVLDLRQLIGGRLDLSDVRVEGADVLVESGPEGELNWELNLEDEEEALAPIVGAFQIDNATVRYRDPGMERELQVILAAAQGTGGRATQHLQVQGEGQFLHLPLQVAVEAGSLNQLQQGEEPYPIDARLAAGDNQFHLAGTVSTPADLQAAELDLQLDAPDPTVILAALGITEEPAPPVAATTRLVHEGAVWALADLDVTIGGSRATGEVVYDLGEEPSHIRAQLLSEGLDGEELVRFFGVLLPTEPLQEGPPPLTEEGLEPRSLPQQRIHVDLDARNVLISPELVLDRLQLAGRIEDRVPHVALAGTGQLRDEPVAVELDLGGERAPDGSYPIEGLIEVAQNRLAVAGRTAQPLDLRALEVEVDLSSTEPSLLLDLAGYPHLDLPAIELRGQLRRDRDIWELPAFSARTGESDLAGALRAALGEGRPRIEAELASEYLNTHDIEPILDAVQELAEVDAPEVALVTVEDGRPRLQPEALPQLDADITYRADRLEGPEFDLREVEGRLLLGEELPALRLVAEGTVLGEETAIDLALGTMDVDPPPAGYPIEARITAEQTRIELSGVIAEPVALEGLNLELDIESPAPARWLELANLPAPELPPIGLSGQLIQEGETWQLRDASLTSGESDLAGTLGASFAEPRPVVQADLASEQVRYDDLAPLADLVQELVPDRPGPPLLTFENGRPRLQPEALPQIDADLAWRADRLQAPDLVLQDVEAQLRLGEELPALRLVGQGMALGEQVEIDVALGMTEEAEAPPSGYPVEAQVAGEQTRIALSGAIEDPVALEGIDLQFEIASLAPERWLALVGLPAPEMPSIGAAGQLIQEEQRWHLPDLYLEAADSNLFGEVVVDFAPERPAVRADLQSNRLIVEELRQLVAGEADGPAGGPIQAGLPEVDLDLDLEIDHVRTGEVRLEPLTLQLRLREQALIMDLAGEGWFHDSPLAVQAQLGSDAALDDPDVRFPVQALLTTPQTEVRADGSVADPFDLAGLEVELAFQGESLEELGEILQLALPSTPPYRMSATLRHENAVWTLADLDGLIGESDIGGEVRADTSGERPAVIADLRSERLDFADLGDVVGDPDEAEEAVEEVPGLPVEEEAVVADLPDIDLELRYAARSVVARQIPVEEVQIEARIEGGVLRVAPLGFELGVGVFTGEIELDAGTEPAQARADLRLQGADAEYIFDLLEIELPDAEPPLAVGRLDARAELAAHGATVSEMVETLDGQLAGIVEGGWVTAVLVQQLGMNLLEILGFFTPDPEEMEPVRCFVADFDISGGVMGVDALVLDTEDSLIVGAGAIDFAGGRIDLAIQAHPKDPAFPVLAPTPVEIIGPFGEIEVGPDPGEIAERFLAALGLGVVLPVVGAAIPFIEPGLAEDSDCAWLIQEAARAAGRS